MWPKARLTHVSQTAITVALSLKPSPYICLALSLLLFEPTLRIRQALAVAAECCKHDLSMCFLASSQTQLGPNLRLWFVLVRYRPSRLNRRTWLTFAEGFVWLFFWVLAKISASGSFWHSVELWVVFGSQSWSDRGVALRCCAMNFWAFIRSFLSSSNHALDWLILALLQKSAPIFVQ